jgi:hypothetical protein
MISYSPVFAGEYAYVLRFNAKEPACLVQFDTEKDEIVKKIEFPSDKAFIIMIQEKTGLRGS